jgi:hypothetical protein
MSEIGRVELSKLLLLDVIRYLESNADSIRHRPDIHVMSRKVNGAFEAFVC